MLGKRTRVYYWRGIDKNKSPAQGLCIADSLSDLRQQLLKKQVLLIQARRKYLKTALNSQQITFLLNQLLTFLRAGIAIIKALEMMQDSEKSQLIAWRIADVKSKIEAGDTLSAALLSQVPAKEKAMLAVITCGERSGNLVETLERLVCQRERERQIRGKLKRAMIYPVFLTLTSAVIITALMVWVVPEFQRTYESMGATLPSYTQTTLDFSRLLRDHGLSGSGALILFCLCLAVLKRSCSGIDWAIARLPLCLPLIRSLLTEYFCRHFAANMRMVYRAGIPLDEALDWFANSGAHPVYCTNLKKVRHDIKRGIPLHQAIKNTAFFPTFVCQVVQAGEHSGTLEQSLEKIERYYDDKIENSIASMMHLIEPALITIIAVCVGWLIFTIYLPIFNLGSIL